MLGLGKKAITKAQAAIIAIIVVIAIIAGAAYYYTTLPSPTPTLVGATKIGFMTGITGAVPIMGRDQLFGALFAAEDINEGKGAWKALGYGPGVLGTRLELVVEDDMANPEVGVTKVKKFILSDNIRLIVGTFSTSVAAAVMPVIAENNAVFLAYNHGLKTIKEYPKSGGWLFMPRVDTMVYGFGLAKAMKDIHPEVKRVVIIGPAYSWGYEFTEGVKAAITRLKWDVELVEEIYPALGTKDFVPFITRILNLGVDAVFCSLYADDFVTFAKQAIPYEFFGKVRFAVTLSGGEIEALGDATPKDILTMEVGLNNLYPKTAEMREFRERFKSRFGVYPAGSSMETYAGIILLCSAIEKVGSTDPWKVKEALEEIEVSLPWTTYKFRKLDHMGVFTAVIGMTGYSEELGRMASLPVYTINTIDVTYTEEEIKAIWTELGLTPPS